MKASVPAACGLCATACPVDIEMGKLTKALRARRAGGIARRVGQTVAEHYGVATAGVRAGLAVADTLHATLGTKAMSALAGGARTLSGKRVPLWTPKCRARASFDPARLPKPAADPAACIVYFPSCAARTMGPARGDAATEDLPAVADRLFRKAGYEVVYPARLAELCCGQPFESKGLTAAADLKSAELARALARGERGTLADRVRHQPVRIPDEALSRRPAERPRPDRGPARPCARAPGARAAARRGRGACRVQRAQAGAGGKLRRIAEACAERVAMPAEVGCCGWAGDKGFTVPELNAHALRDLRSALPAGCTDGYSTSRTCEIGLAHHSGVPVPVDHVPRRRVRAAASGASGGGNQERLIMTNRSKLEALRASKLAVELSPEQCGVLADLIDFRDLKAGDVLVREGTRDNHLYVIVSGAVGVVKSAGGSGETTLLTLADGAFVDELSFMDGTAHYASLVALGDTCVFGLERQKLESLLATHPEIVYRVMRAIIRAVHQIQRQLSRHSVELSNNIHEQTGRH